MASNLYEVLGLEQTATAEEVRKAYRKTALKTHPDRLPPGVSPADKQKANEQFRLVNNAYEVLTDENNRKLYDQYGVWPPPTAVEPEVRPSASTTFTYGGPNPPFFNTDPFFSGSSLGRSWGFRDPFELFSSLFGDIHNIHDDFDEFDTPFFGMRSTPLFMSSSLSSMHPLSAGFPFGGPSLLSGFGGATSGTNVRSYSSTTQAIGQGGQWVSQSTMTRTINGRTEQIIRRRDAQGNEHVTHSSPDGERYTINGVEQPTNNALSASSTGPRPALPQTSRPSSSRSYGTNMDINSSQQRIAVTPQYQQPPVVPPPTLYDQHGDMRRSASHHSYQRYHDTHAKQPYADPGNYRHSRSSHHSSDTQHHMSQPPPSVNYPHRPEPSSASSRSRESGHTYPGRSSGQTNYNINADGSNFTGAHNSRWPGW